jgi:hypothetical protein
MICSDAYHQRVDLAIASARKQSDLQVTLAAPEWALVDKRLTYPLTVRNLGQLAASKVHSLCGHCPGWQPGARLSHSLSPSDQAQTCRLATA